MLLYVVKSVISALLGKIFLRLWITPLVASIELKQLSTIQKESVLQLSWLQVLKKKVYNFFEPLEILESEKYSTAADVYRYLVGYFFVKVQFFAACLSDIDRKSPLLRRGVFYCLENF